MLIDGNIEFFDGPEENEDGDTKTSICRQLMTSSPPDFSQPPKAPKGEWKSHKLSRGIEDMLGNGALGHTHDLMRSMEPSCDVFIHRDLTPPKRDPNGFN